jgi:subtilisin family serine protease
MPKIDDGLDDPPGQLDLLEEEEQRSSAGLAVERRFEILQSPLLPPQILAQYGEVVEGLPARLVEWTERESQHRRILVAGYVAVAGTGAGAPLVAGVIAIVSVGGPFAARLLAERWRGAATEASDRSDNKG